MLQTGLIHIEGEVFYPDVLSALESWPAAGAVIGTLISQEQYDKRMIEHLCT